MNTLQLKDRRFVYEVGDVVILPAKKKPKKVEELNTSKGKSKNERK